jgi:hypothetical protein
MRGTELFFVQCEGEGFPCSVLGILSTPRGITNEGINEHTLVLSISHRHGRAFLCAARGAFNKTDQDSKNALSKKYQYSKNEHGGKNAFRKKYQHSKNEHGKNAFSMKYQCSKNEHGGMNEFSKKYQCSKNGAW